MLPGMRKHVQPPALRHLRSCRLLRVAAGRRACTCAARGTPRDLFHARAEGVRVVLPGSPLRRVSGGQARDGGFGRGPRRWPRPPTAPWPALASADRGDHGRSWASSTPSSRPAAPSATWGHATSTTGIASVFVVDSPVVWNSSAMRSPFDPTQREPGRVLYEAGSEKPWLSPGTPCAPCSLPRRGAPPSRTGVADPAARRPTVARPARGRDADSSATVRDRASPPRWRR
jgi:hypothetical protein